MFKIKDLILEEVEKEKVKEDCKTYIEKNRELLENDFHIWRVSGSGRDPREIYHVPMRKRRSIKGNKIITYFFRKYKPSDVPNRRVTFSSQGGEVSHRFAEHGTHFKLFPVSENYKIYYHPDVEDFNYNDLHFDYTKRLEPIGRIRRDLDLGFTSEKTAEAIIDGTQNIAFTGDTMNLSTFQEMQEDVGEKANDLIRKYFAASEEKGDESYTFNAIDDLFTFLEKNRGDFEEYLPKTYDLLDAYKNYIRDYFVGYRGVQKLDKSMYNRELSVYAPDGVYYVGGHVNVV